MIPGIIVSSNVVLLQHKSAKNLDFVIEQYVNSNPSYPFWFAEFDLDAVKAELRTNRPWKSLRRRFVLCQVRKTGSKGAKTQSPWVATTVELVENKKGPWVPDYEAYRASRRRKNKKEVYDRVDQRLNRLQQSVPSNIRHPWRG